MSQMPRKTRPTKKATNQCRSGGAGCSDITVYQGGPAVVREQLMMDLKAGDNVVFLEGMPTGFQPNSLVVLEYEGVLNTGKLGLGPISYRAANLDKARILAASIGQPVEAARM